MFRGVKISPLKGNPISSLNVDARDLEIAFDNKLGNYIATPKIGDYNGEWIGMDFGERKQIVYIGYSPRNDLNNVTRDNRYELFYWDGEWKSLGVGEWTDDVKLKFKVPKSALMILRNLQKG